MDDDGSCTTTTSIDSIEDTANRQKPTQPIPADKSNCESMPKLTSREYKMERKLTPLFVILQIRAKVHPLTMAMELTPLLVILLV